MLALLEDPEAVIICNGYKDDAYLELALLAQRLGRRCVIVLEQFESSGMPCGSASSWAYRLCSASAASSAHPARVAGRPPAEIDRIPASDQGDHEGSGDPERA